MIFQNRFAQLAKLLPDLLDIQPGGIEAGVMIPSELVDERSDLAQLPRPPRQHDRVLVGSARSRSWIPAGRLDDDHARETTDAEADRAGRGGDRGMLLLGEADP